MSAMALVGAAVVTPAGVISDGAVIIDGERIISVGDAASVAAAVPSQRLSGGYLLAGFIDTQVNGGGDVLFNDEPTLDGVCAIAAAHRRFGTTALLPTLISDDRVVMERAIAAVDQAIAEGVPGVIGIHVEGPYLNPAKHGIHDQAKFRDLVCEPE